MTVIFEIPDQLAASLATNGVDPARAVLEAVALEGYRKDLLSEAGVRRMLGFKTREQVHGFLKEHGVCQHYTMKDLDHDIAESDRYLALLDRRLAELHAG